jgi:hypothetical protein
MQELCGRELESSQRTGLAETSKGANNEVNIRLEVKKIEPHLKNPLHHFKLPPILLNQTILFIVQKKPINSLTQI